MENLIAIDGQPTSTAIAEQLVTEGRPVLVAFSGGKDAICALTHLQRYGIDVVPYHMQVVPGLAFVNNYLDWWEQRLGRHIIRIPHPSFWRWINNLVYQPPDRVADILAADTPNYDYTDVITALRDDYAEPTTWVADGVRAADSIVRRASIGRHGAMKRHSGKVSVVWDWRISHVRQLLADERIPLPPDYEWFGRSFDGIDRRFLKPLRDHAPDDYRRILNFFPLAELELVRHANT